MNTVPEFNPNIIKTEVIINELLFKELISDSTEYPFVEEEYFFERSDILLWMRCIKFKRVYIKKRYKRKRQRVLKMVGQVANLQVNVVANDMQITHYNSLKTASTSILDIWKHVRAKSKMFPILSVALIHVRLQDFFPKTDSFQSFMADQILFQNVRYRVSKRDRKYRIQHYINFFKEIFVILKRQLRPVARKYMLRNFSRLLIKGSLRSSAKRYRKKSTIYFFGFKLKVKNPKRKNRKYLRKLKSFYVRNKQIYPVLRKRKKRGISILRYNIARSIIKRKKILRRTMINVRKAVSNISKNKKVRHKKKFSFSNIKQLPIKKTKSFSSKPIKPKYKKYKKYKKHEKHEKKKRSKFS